MRGWSIFVLIIAVVVSCSKRPDDIIKEDKMVEIMADLQIAEAYDRNGKSDPEMHGSKRELLGRGILMSHGVTLEEMDSTIAWYGRNMDEYSKLYKKVDQRLAKMQIKYARAAGESENDGPSTDLWPYGRHFVIDNNQLTGGIVIDISTPDLTAGDKLTWKMRTHGASERQMTLGVNYDNGRTEIVNIKNNSFDPWIEMSLQTDSVQTVTRIFGILTVDHSAPRVFVDSIQLIHYPFNSEEYHRAGYQRKIGIARKYVKEMTTDSLSLDKQEISKDSVPSVSSEKTELSEKLKMHEPLRALEPKKTTLKPIKAR